MLLSPHELSLTNLLDILSYLDAIIISFTKTHILFISKHFLTMVLPVNNGNISLSCTIYSQLPVKHVHRPQALAFCMVALPRRPGVFKHSAVFFFFITFLLNCLKCNLRLLSTNHHKPNYGGKKLDQAKFTTLYALTSLDFLYLKWPISVLIWKLFGQSWWFTWTRTAVGQCKLWMQNELWMKLFCHRGQTGWSGIFVSVP